MNKHTKKSCAVYVTKRNYGAPGPCEGEQELRQTHYNGEHHIMCAAHRAMAYRGQALKLCQDVPLAEHRRLCELAEARA